MYSNNVIRRAEQILGYGITTTAGERTYPIIDGVIYTDLFEGNAPDGYTKALNGRVNGISYYNELIVNNYHRSTCPKTASLTLTWGSTAFMTDIDELLQWLEDNPAVDSLDNAGVKSKKIEDFSVSYGSDEDKQNDIASVLKSTYGFYIRKPLIISIAPEQRDASRYF